MTRLALIIWLLPWPAAAQILSPGPLGRAHANLEGLGKCTSCHELGEGVDGQRCLACHKQLARALREQRGLHADVSGRACTECHQEHQGRDAALSDWGGAQKKFNHARAGWQLTGKHAGAACGACHRALLVRNTQLKNRLQKRAESTYLGLGTRCTSCHFDEHRGQLKQGCDTCHDTKSFTSARGFEHARAWKLRGAHARVECKGCHETKQEAATSTVLPPVRADGFVRYDIGQPKGCTSCHRDVHGGKFGSRCTRCHDETTWRRIRGKAGDVAFHDATRFPLKGRHREASCESCHPREKNGRMKTRGLKFGACTDCHVDAHLGQLAASRAGCEPCHDENGFYPPRYPIARHDETRFPLEGAHRAAACNGCHLADPSGLASRVPEKLRDAGAPGGHELINFTRFVFPERDLERCDSCHRDPHAGQFQRGETGKACASCHTVATFLDVRIDHDRDTRFPLTGKHAKVRCNACHLRAAEDGPVVFRGAPIACAACHTDPHLGQFGSTSKSGADCGRCHDTGGFRPATFEHADAFALEGAHARVPCERCHPRIEPAPGIQASWYRGVPSRCDGCHENIHARDQAGQKLLASVDAGADCVACHESSDWHQVLFDHENTRLPLRGRHAQLACRACHESVTQVRLDPRCQACHTNPHAGRLGQVCERCHEATSFRDGVGVAAHSQTRFPLYGRHAMVPCDECHQARLDATFGGVPTRCEACHMDQYRATAGSAFDHVAAGIGTGCRRCHNAVSWQRGVLPEHDRCFPLTRGPHRGITCVECHTSLPGVSIDGCDSFNASCTRCHSCARMDDKHLGEESVPGYQCADRKCYECHPGGREDG